MTKRRREPIFGPNALMFAVHFIVFSVAGWAIYSLVDGPAKFIAHWLVCPFFGSC